jgi:hypothetical protein
MHESISSNLIIQKKDFDKVEEWPVQVVVTVVFSPTGIKPHQPVRFFQPRNLPPFPLDQRKYNHSALQTRQFSEDKPTDGKRNSQDLRTGLESNLKDRPSERTTSKLQSSIALPPCKSQHQPVRYL